MSLDFPDVPPAEKPLEPAAFPSRRQAKPSRRTSLARLMPSRPVSPRQGLARRSPAVSSSTPRRRMGTGTIRKFMAFGAMVGAAALLVSTSLPASAFYSAPDQSAGSLVVATAAKTGVQKLSVDQITAATVPARDSYTIIPPAPKIVPAAARTVSAVAIHGGTYTNDPNGTIQWPFPVTVQITSGFGARDVAGCGYCTTFHEGLDFTPGAGVPIQAIADGVVRTVQLNGSAYGNNVWIDHVINGQKVTSGYAHMQTGSVRMVEGQVVHVGDIVGQVGSTGASTGAHLHLEIHLDGTPVDPFAWLKANAN